MRQAFLLVTMNSVSTFRNSAVLSNKLWMWWKVFLICLEKSRVGFLLLRLTASWELELLEMTLNRLQNPQGIQIERSLLLLSAVTLLYFYTLKFIYYAKTPESSHYDEETLFIWKWSTNINERRCFKLKEEGTQSVLRGKTIPCLG